jgi:DnaJ-class molecular chaperone
MDEYDDFDGMDDYREPEFKTCPDCNGKGWVTGTTLDKDGDPEPYPEPCFGCKGTGKVKGAK